MGGQLLHWAGIDLFLLAFSTGMVLVPGALIALARPRSRGGVVRLPSAVVFGAGLSRSRALRLTGSARFPERYLFALLPLVPIAFGLYVKHGRPARIPVALISLFLFAVSATLPLSGYSGAIGKTDSPFLTAVFRLETAVGTANGALVLAGLAAVGAAGAVLVSRRGGARYALGATLAFAIVTSCFTIADSANARDVRHQYLPANPSWVDATGLRDVTLLQTAGAPAAGAVEQLYWNRSITAMALVGAAMPTDVYAAPRIHVARDGTLLGVGPQRARAGLRRDRTVCERPPRRERRNVLSVVGRLGPTACAPRARPLLRRLARPHRQAAASGPTAGGRTRGTLSFALSLPPSATTTTVNFGKAHYDVHPGAKTTVDLHARRARALVTAVLHGERGQRARPSLHERALDPARVHTRRPAGARR